MQYRLLNEVTTERIKLFLVGNVYTMGLGAESKAVRYLFDTLGSDENKKRSSLLGLDPILAGLAETQDAIDGLYVERTMLEPELDRYTLKNAMQAVVHAVRRFLGYVDVVAGNNDPDSTELLSEVQRILADVEAIARGRKTRFENDGVLILRISTSCPDEASNTAREAGIFSSSLISILKPRE
jgi:hypothetical protein